MRDNEYAISLEQHTIDRAFQEAQVSPEDDLGETLGDLIVDAVGEPELEEIEVKRTYKGFCKPAASHWNASLKKEGTKLWCKECQALRYVSDFHTLARTAVLSCGHTRPETL